MTHAEAQIKKLFGRLENIFRKIKRNASPGVVHHLRTTIRRLEVVLNYSQPMVDEKQNKALKKLFSIRKRAGRVRDLDVQVILLGAIANRSCAADIAYLRQVAQKKREKRAVYLISAVRKLERSRLAVHLSRVSENLSSAPETKDPDGPLHEALRQLEKMKADFAVHPRLGPKRLHAIRILLKKVRYLAEIAAASESKIRFLSEIRLVQNAVGEWHDWELLARNAGKEFRDRQNCPLLSEILSLFALKRHAAVSRVRAYLTRETAPARKQPRSSSPTRALAQRA
jgi:CHAD domain-containing protein